MERRGWLSGDESEAAVGVQARGRGGTETDEDGDGEGWLQRSRLEASVGVRACGGRREARVVKKGHPCRGWTSPPVAPEGGDDAECAGTCRDAVIVIWSRQSVSLLRQTRSVQWSPPRPSLGLRLRFLAGLSGICSRGVGASAPCSPVLIRSCIIISLLIIINFNIIMILLLSI